MRRRQGSRLAGGLEGIEVSNQIRTAVEFRREAPAVGRGVLWTLRNPILTTGWAKELVPRVISSVRQRGGGSA